MRAALLLGAVVLVGCGGGAREALRVEKGPGVMRADGVSRERVRVSGAAGRRLTARVVRGERRVSVEAVAGGEIALRAGVLPGEAVVEVGPAPGVTFTVRVEADGTDVDEDGFPDALRLEADADRAVFLRRFSGIADGLFGAAELPREVNDCGALLRFAYREALRGEIVKYQYPFTPLGAELFRVRAGAYRAEERGAFAQFADAETLMRRNTWLVTREVGRGQRGDLLFYRQLEQSMPFHAMVLLGEHAVYHTGPIGKWPGEMRRPTIEELLRHPEPRWRPLVGNPNFLGVFRWKILKDTV
ncbi:MAG: DUF1175 family protein [Bryobacteraceae bacterium]|nr:DUF1175 family protein [Bryobacteraceae bacterium]